MPQGLPQISISSQRYHRGGPARGGGGGGGSRVACLNFKMSRVGVLSYFTSLSEIEKKKKIVCLCRNLSFSTEYEH